MAKKYPRKFNFHSPHFLKSAFLVIFGLILIGFYGVWKFNQVYIAFTLTSDQITSQTNPAETLPQKVIIPKLNLNLEVTESVIKNGVWGVSDKGVSHLVTSAVPGQKNNIVIYGHNKAGILGSLPEVVVGDKITVETQGGQTYEYSVSKTRIVAPQDIWALNEEDREQLIIYTCTGFLDSQRLIVYANPV